MNCVYKIENKINGKVYIGETLDKDERWNKHIEDLNNNNHHSWKLQKDWNEYGKDNFEFSVIDSAKESHEPYSQKLHLIMKEHICISEYNSIECGYNVENTLKEIIDGTKTVLGGGKSKHILTDMYNNLCKGKYQFPNNEMITSSEKKNTIVVFSNLKEAKEIKLESARQKLKRIIKRHISLDEIYDRVVINGMWEVDDIKVCKLDK